MPEPPKSRILAIAAFGFGLAALIVGAAADTKIPPRPVSDRWAVVKSDGALARGKGALSSTRLGPGTYEVVFSSSVATCVYQATLGNAGTGVPPVGTIGVLPRAGVPKAVLVIINDLAGTTPKAAGFHLFVSCPRVSLAADAGAVENPAAAEPRLGTNDRWVLVKNINSWRGRGVVDVNSLPHPTSAREVIFDRNVSQCAYLASQIEELDGGFHGTSQIGVAARGRNSNGVFVKATIYGGSTPTFPPFALIVKCP